MAQMNILDALGPVVDALEELGVPYHIGGSIASSAQGFARSTLDADLVADLKPEHISPFVESLQVTYYIDADMIMDAIAHQSSFNLIHLPTMFKIDVFIPKGKPFDRLAFRRAYKDTLDDAPNARPFYLASAEDIVLRKLQWYKAGGEVAERQWSDVLGVLKVQGAALDLPYLQQWAGELEVESLLASALAEAGL